MQTWKKSLKIMTCICLLLLMHVSMSKADEKITVTKQQIGDDFISSFAKNARFGISVVRPDNYDIDSCGASWYLTWTHVPARNTKLEFMPMIAGYTLDKNVSDKYMSDLEQRIKTFKGDYPDHTIWMVGNEIGYYPQHDHRTPEQYAEDYHRCYTMLKKINPTYKLAVGAIILSNNIEYVTSQYVEHKGGYHYLKRVREAYKAKFGEEIPVDYYTATCHVVEDKSTNYEVFKEQVIRLRKFLAEIDERDKPVIITEFGCSFVGAEPEKIKLFMKETVEFLISSKDEKIGCTTDDNKLVQRFAWFTLHGLSLEEKAKYIGEAATHIDLNQTSLMDKNGKLNELGKMYKEYIFSASKKL